MSQPYLNRHTVKNPFCFFSSSQELYSLDLSIMLFSWGKRLSTVHRLSVHCHKGYFGSYLILGVERVPDNINVLNPTTQNKADVIH